MNREGLKKQARALQTARAAEGQPTRLAEALEHVARAYGYRDWNTAAAVLKDTHSMQRHFVEMPNIRQAYLIDERAFGDVRLGGEIDLNLDDILEDLSHVRHWPVSFREDPTVQNLIGALQHAEGKGWLIRLAERPEDRGRWMYLTSLPAALILARHEHALDRAEEDMNLNVREAIERAKRLVTLRFADLDSTPPVFGPPRNASTRLTALLTRHAHCTGFPYDAPRPADPAEIQSARQDDRLETLALQAQIKVTDAPRR